MRPTPRTLTPRTLGLVALACVGAALLVTARSLPQRNSLDLYLGEEGLARYERFRTRFDERPTLLGRLRIAEDGGVAAVDDTVRTRLADGLDAVRSIAERVGADLVTSQELAGSGASPDGPASSEGALLELRGPFHEAFIAILPPGGEESSGAPLVSALLDLGARTGLEVDLAGVPYTRFELDRWSSAIGDTLFPLVFALGFVIVLAMVRSPRAAALVYVPALIATGIALTALRLGYGSMDMVTAIVPLLVFVLNLTLALHLRAAAVTLGSFGRGLAEKARPIALMVLTTSVGFGSLSFSEIESVRRFGILTGTLVILTAGTTLLWMSLAAPTLSALGDTARRRTDGRVAALLLRRPSPLLVGLAVVAVALGGSYGVATIPVETDALTYFPDSSGIAERVRTLQSEVLGTPLIEIVANPGSEEDALATLDAVTRAVEETVGGSARVVSRSSLLREAHRRWDGAAVLPEGDLVALALWRALPAPLRDAYGRPGVERITVFGESHGAAAQRAAIARLEETLAATAPAWSFSYEGMVQELLAAQEALIRILGRSFGLSLLVIAGVFWVSRRSVRMLAVFVVTNAVPVVGGFGVARALGYSLDVATVMVASIALGMIVDSTLHIVHSLDRLGGRAGLADPERRAVYLRGTLDPVLGSGVVLVPCFLAFAAFEFSPIRQFGVTLGATVLLALLFDLYALPVLHELARGRTPSGVGPAPGRSKSPGGRASEREVEPDAIVVGAGSAGLSFAARLAERGGSVLVLEADASLRRHVCGEYLCPSGVTVVEELGWSELLEGCAPVTGMVLVSPRGRVVPGDFPTDGAHRDGVSIDKRALAERLLARAARSGASVRFGTRVESIERTPDGWRITLDDGTERTTRLLVGADGRRSLVARTLGLTRPARQRRVAVRGFVTPVGVHERRGEIHLVGDGSYVGVNPISPDEVNVSICLDTERLRELGGPQGAFDHAVARSPRLAARYDWSTLRDVRGATPLTHRVCSPITEGAALIGDAGGFLDPLTGEGMSIALWTGAALADRVAAPLAARDPRALRRALRAFARAKRARFGPKLLLSRSLQWVIRRPELCERIARTLGDSPARTRAFLGAIGNQYSPLEALWRIALADGGRPRPPSRGPVGEALEVRG